MALLSVCNLAVEFPASTGTVKAVNGVSFHIEAGETLALVGESGSGKSITALAVMQLLPGAAQLSAGEILWEGQDLVRLSGAAMQRIRGARIGMIFQEPMSALNPVLRCGFQVEEVLKVHKRGNKKEIRERIFYLFERVRLPDPARIYRAYPHELSGGQKQRVMIAMALACNPQLLIADEPTTALDVTVQKAILDLLAELRQEFGLSMLFISHDIGVVQEIADRVAVMYKGNIVEQGPVHSVIHAPVHPYTRGLLACRPSLVRRVERLPTVSDFTAGNGDFAPRVIGEAETTRRRTELYRHPPLLEVKDLKVHFPVRRAWNSGPRQWVKAVDEVSFSVYPGETLGIAGESGCGKTTLGRTIARLQKAGSGTIAFDGTDLLPLTDHAFKPFRRAIQVIFQDPYASLNPRMTIGKAITEPLEVHKIHPLASQRRAHAIHLLEQVGLGAQHFDRYPHEFSGGQRQRICIARALTLNPRLLICDEIVSALDVSVQAQVLNLLAGLQEKFGLTCLFISHDLGVLHQVSDRIMVMRNGRVEAIGFPEVLFKNSEQNYVRELVAAVPGQNLEMPGL